MMQGGDDEELWNRPFAPYLFRMWSRPLVRRLKETCGSPNLMLMAMVLLPLLLYVATGSRGFERTMMLIFSGGLVFLGMTWKFGLSPSILSFR